MDVGGMYVLSKDESWWYIWSRL